MSAVNVTSVTVLDNPSSFTAPLRLEIQYECLYALKDDLEFKLTYVGSATDEKCDQELESVLVGPVHPGQYKFIFQADAPDPEKLPADDIVGVTAILLGCLYKGKEFIRVGYYVYNEYELAEMNENPPDKPVIDKIRRNILQEKPRVILKECNFDNEEDLAQPEPADEDMAAAPSSVIDAMTTDAV